MGLTTEGIIFWILGWGFVISLVVFCLVNILKNPRGNNLDKK